MPVEIKLIASSANWIEGDAVAQLEKTAALPGMPDLHPGKGTPIGAAFATEGRFYPHLVGNDIGCGMALYDTDLAVSKLKPEKWLRKLAALEGPWEGDTAAWLAERGVAPARGERWGQHQALGPAPGAGAGQPGADVRG